MKPLSDIYTFWSAPAIGWIMLLLLLCLIMMNAIRRGLIVDSFRMAVSNIDRNTFSQTETEPLVRVMGALVRLGIAGMALYLVTNTGGQWHIGHYLMMMLLVAGLHLVKILAACWMNWLFQWVNRYELLVEHLTALWTAVAVLLLPVTLVYLSLPDLPYLPIVLAVVIGMYICAYFVKLIRFRMQDLFSMVLILIYILTTEVLPLSGVYLLAEHINNTL